MGNIEGALHNAISRSLWEQDTTHIMCILPRHLRRYVIVTTLEKILCIGRNRELLDHFVCYDGCQGLWLWSSGSNLAWVTGLKV
jgi:hypothetical protein